MHDVDICVIGGGIVALSTAMQLLERFPGLSVAVVEKEEELALHQSARNSGVLHAGVYYAPGSLKARFCKAGVVDTLEFCRSHAIPIEQCGKLLVATSDHEADGMRQLAIRARENGLDVEELNRSELEQCEPRIRGVGALRVRESGIVDWRAVALAMAERVRAAGGQIINNFEVEDIRESGAGLSITASSKSISARFAIACAGLMADRLARMCGIQADFKIVPFRGEYFRLPESKDDIVRHLIYPIPDPSMPFLGVHLTRMIGGYVTVGPNAVLAFAREGYSRRDVKLTDIAEYASFPGFWRMLTKNLRPGIAEMRSSFSRAHYLELCRKYCPELVLDDLQPYRSGVRAQAVLRDGSLVHDFLVRTTGRTIHVCNAPSPAATCSIPIGGYVTDLAANHFGLAT